MAGGSYKIDINVNAKGGGRSGGGGGGGSTRELLEQSRAAAGIGRDEHGHKGNLNSPGQTNKLMVLLNKNLINLNKSIQLLTAAVNHGSGGGGIGGGHGGTSGGGHGGPGSRGSGRAGSYGKALVGGALLGASTVGYAWGKVSEIGHAGIAARLEQKGTAGVAGLQGSRGNYFSGAESGEFMKAYKMGSNNDKSGNWKDTMQRTGSTSAVETIDGHVRTESGVNSGYTVDEYMARYGTLPTRTSATYGAKTGYSNVMNYATKFGIGAGELGQMAGSAGAVSGSSGMDSVGRMIQTGMKGNAGLEMPAIMNAVQGTLQEAVKQGVQDSKLGEDLVKEIAAFQRVTKNNKADLGIGIVQKGVGLQQQVASGKWGSYQGWQMYKAGEEMLGNFNPANEHVQSLVSQGVISQDQLKRGLTPAERSLAIESLSQSNPEAMRGNYISKFIKSYGGGTGKTYEETLAHLNQNKELLGLGDKPSEIRAILDKYGPASLVGGKRAADRAEATGDMEKMVMDRGGYGGVETAAAVGFGRENMLLFNSAVTKAIGAVGTVDAAMIEFAGVISDDAATAIKAFDDALIEVAPTMVEGARRIVEGIRDMFGGSSPSGRPTG